MAMAIIFTMHLDVKYSEVFVSMTENQSTKSKPVPSDFDLLYEVFRFRCVFSDCLVDECLINVVGF